MKTQKRMKNIFADKATLIPRKMISELGKKLVVRDFTQALDISLGMAQGVLESMEKRGYVERVKKGPDSYTVLTNQDKLLEGWLKEYQFELNEVDTYYSPDKDILKEIRDYFKADKYALTLHTGANLITSYVRTDDIYFYLDAKKWDKDILDIRQRLGLKELVKGGNIHIVKPYYKNSVFFNCQKIRGYRVVSNLQLYLDLYNFQPRGKEHAEYLRKILKERGRDLG